MIQPSLKQLEAISALSSNPNFSIFIEWIRESEHVTMRSSLNIKEELQLRWNQGKLQNMNDILKAIEEVFILLEAHKNYAPVGTNPDI
jgi:hypothetical protein